MFYWIKFDRYEILLAIFQSVNLPRVLANKISVYFELLSDAPMNDTGAIRHYIFYFVSKISKMTQNMNYDDLNGFCNGGILHSLNITLI